MKRLVLLALAFTGCMPTVTTRTTVERKSQVTSIAPDAGPNGSWVAYRYTTIWRTFQTTVDGPQKKTAMTSEETKSQDAVWLCRQTEGESAPRCARVSFVAPSSTPPSE